MIDVPQKRIQVVYFQRKRRPNANFSLEFIFDDVRSRLQDEIDAVVRIAPCQSNGLFRRLWICLDAIWHQGHVNHVTGDTNFVAIGLSRRCTILTVLDCGFLHREPGLRRWLLKKIWLDLPVRSATVVTTISESARQEIVALTGCAADKVIVVPVAVSDAFQPSPREMNTESPRILQIGTAPNKNLLRSIEALSGIPCTLVVIGKLNMQTREALTSHQISFENYFELSDEQMRRQYHLADIVLFPSTYEGFGMPIVEGQRVGRPVVTSNLSSMPEVAGDGACLVNPLDVASIRAGVLRVLEDAAFRQELILNGFVNARRFDAEQIARQYHAVYHRLAALPSSAGDD